MHFSLLAISVTILASVVTAVPADSAYVNAGSDVQISQQDLVSDILQNTQALYKSDKEGGKDDDKKEPVFEWDGEVFHRGEQETPEEAQKKAEALDKEIWKGAALLKAECIKATTTIPAETSVIDQTTTTTIPNSSTTIFTTTTSPTTTTTTTTSRGVSTTTSTSTNTSTEVTTTTSSTTTTTETTSVATNIVTTTTTTTLITTEP